MFNSPSKPTAEVVDENKNAGEFRTLKLNEIVESKDNPRTQFDSAKLAELAASFKKVGVVEPIVVRRRNAGLGGLVTVSCGYEIVAGARRYRAAKKAGLAEIPAIVRKYNDAQALKVQLIENLQREDIDPLDEATSFKRLTELNGAEKMTVAQIASEIGKSEEYVYARLKLLEAAAPVRTALQKGQIKTEHAVILARLPEKDQTAGLAECTHPHQPARVSELRLWAKERDDQNKKRQRVQAEISRAKAAGAKVVFLNQYSYHGRIKGALQSGEYVIAGKTKCDHGARGFYVDDDIADYTGRSELVCTNPQTCKVHKVAQQSGTSRRVKTETEKRREREGLAQTAAERQIDAAIVAKVSALDTPLLRLVTTEYASDIWHDRRKELCRRHGWAPIKKQSGADYDKPIASAISKMDSRALAQMLVEILLTDPGREGEACRTALAKRYKIDAAKIHSKCIADTHAKYKAAQAKKAPKPAKKPKPVRGKCRVCGCTETTPCGIGLYACAWEDKAKTLCTNPKCLRAAKKLQTSAKPPQSKKSAKRKVQTSAKPKRRLAAKPHK